MKGHSLWKWSAEVKMGQTQRCWSRGRSPRSLQLNGYGALMGMGAQDPIGPEGRLSEGTQK
jgi:hypothetical protein